MPQAVHNPRGLLSSHFTAAHAPGSHVIEKRSPSMTLRGAVAITLQSLTDI
jgi:hypothetical protein